MPYRLMSPIGQGVHRRYPLVVFLHGAGERGTDNQQHIRSGTGAHELIRAADHHTCFFLAPQCPPVDSWSGVAWDRLPYHMHTEPIRPMRVVLDLIGELCRSHPIDRSRIFATGLSMGALGMWDMVMRAPGLFAAGIPICGGYDATHVDSIRDIPFWVFHGSADPSVPVEGSRTMVRALERVGGSVRYTEYEGAGHAIWAQIYRNREVIDWLFCQSR